MQQFRQFSSVLLKRLAFQNPQLCCYVELRIVSPASEDDDRGVSRPENNKHIGGGSPRPRPDPECDHYICIHIR